MAEITATMSGNVWKVEVKEGDKIQNGDVVVILESMKMEIPIEAEESGVVQEIKTTEGEFVQEGDVLISLAND